MSPLSSGVVPPEDLIHSLFGSKRPWSTTLSEPPFAPKHADRIPPACRLSRVPHSHGVLTTQVAGLWTSTRTGPATETAGWRLGSALLRPTLRADAADVAGEVIPTGDAQPLLTTTPTTRRTTDEGDRGARGEEYKRYPALPDAGTSSRARDQQDSRNA
jgi:hypothetical protein